MKPVPPPPLRVTLGGLLGTALDASRRGRLRHFIAGPDSPALLLFQRSVALRNTEGDWYGEHAGKWLVAAARAAVRHGDAQLADQVREVADHLAGQQEADGYLGTYAPSHRFTVKRPPKPHSWDGAPSVRTWDIWTHSYLILGLLEAHRALGESRWLQAACRIGDLCAITLEAGDIDITDLGNHHGLSATVLMDPACELFFATGEPRYVDLAERILAQADAHPPLALLTKAAAGVDPSEIGTGKAYQLAWNLVGLAKLYRATGREELRHALERQWQAIRDHHLTLGGGPWGGVAHRSREVFNPAGVFSPQGYVETCSTLAWLQLNRELLAITGQACYADEIERSAYNDLLAAQAPNGEDWCYYVFPNGRRVHTTYWRCCKSSGAMALEELPLAAYGQRSEPEEEQLTIHLYGAGMAAFTMSDGSRVELHQDTRFPLDGEVRLQVASDRPCTFTLRLRGPGWAAGATLRVNGDAPEPLPFGQYTALRRRWVSGDTIDVQLPMRPRLHRSVNRNVQESRAPDGSPVRQQVLHDAYVAITCGPLVFATDLIDGYKTQESVRLPAGPAHTWLQLQATEPMPTILMQPEDRPPIEFMPSFAVGGRADGSWRVTWLSLAPGGDSCTSFRDD